MVIESEKSDKETNKFPIIELKTEPIIELNQKITKQEHGDEYWSNESNNAESFAFESTITIKMDPIG